MNKVGLFIDALFLALAADVDALGWLIWSPVQCG